MTKPVFFTHYLSELTEGMSARVMALTGEAGMCGRLMELGLTPGVCVECLFKSPLGDPTAYRIRGAVIALRAKDAEGIRIM